MEKEEIKEEFLEEEVRDNINEEKVLPLAMRLYQPDAPTNNQLQRLVTDTKEENKQQRGEEEVKAKETNQKQKTRNQEAIAQKSQKTRKKSSEDTEDMLA